MFYFPVSLFGHGFYKSFFKYLPNCSGMQPICDLLSFVRILICSSFACISFHLKYACLNVVRYGLPSFVLGNDVYAYGDLWFIRYWFLGRGLGLSAALVDSGWIRCAAVISQCLPRPWTTCTQLSSPVLSLLSANFHFPWMSSLQIITLRMPFWIYNM